MRRALAAVVEMVIFALASGLLAQAAWAAATVDACATRTDMLGISRVIEVDTTGGPMFGRSPQGAFDVLGDHEVILVVSVEITDSERFGKASGGRCS